MNKIWAFLIVISIVFSFISGNINNINNIVFKQMESATEYILNIAFLMAFWAGINNIILNTKLKDYLKKVFKPFFKLIYGKTFSEEIIDLLSLNTFGNLFGLGNISTISGIKVIDKIDEINVNYKNRKEFADDIIIFTVLNTASIQLLPITILNIRYSLGANIVSEIIKYVWLVSFISFFVLIIVTKLYLKIRVRRMKI